MCASVIHLVDLTNASEPSFNIELGYHNISQHPTFSAWSRTSNLSLLHGRILLCFQTHLSTLFIRKFPPGC